MQTIDKILTGGTVVTMNQQFDVIHHGAVAIHENKIIDIDRAETISKKYTAQDTTDCTNQYILPGLINTHTHVPMTLLRGMSDDSRLDVWLMGYIMPTEREFVSPEFCQLGTSLACAEMIRGGVTTFTDMYYFESDIADATAKAGMRALLGETVLKFPAPDAESYEESLTYTREFIQKWKGHPLITPAIAPHAPYSNTEGTLKKCVDVAVEFDVPLIIHIAETRQEVEDHLKDYEQSVVHWLNKIGLFRARVLAAHCVWIDETEMRIFREKGAAVAHCPSANLKLSSGVAAVAQMLESNVTVGIGTDGPASNNDLDMFEEMRLAALLAKTKTYNPTVVPAKQALLMATRMGAKALSLDDQVGSLEIGKNADIIILESRPLHNMPHFDFNPDAVYSQIVYAAKASDVRHTMVNGQWLMKNRSLLTLDEEKLKVEAMVYADKIGAFLAHHQGNVLQKLISITGGLERSESFEVQVKAILRNSDNVEQLLDHPDVEVLRSTHYRQYDTYFLFEDDRRGRVRYREDDKLDASGELTEVRARLTYTSPEKEREFNRTVLLSHSRFIAPADRPLRFYQEYFQADEEKRLLKERRRWRIHYQGVLFNINIDKILEPSIPQMFIEIKSRTWSLSDAEIKADRIQEMLKILDISTDDIITEDYLEMDEITK